MWKKLVLLIHKAWGEENSLHSFAAEIWFRPVQNASESKMYGSYVHQSSRLSSAVLPAWNEKGSRITFRPRKMLRRQEECRPEKIPYEGKLEPENKKVEESSPPCALARE